MKGLDARLRKLMAPSAIGLVGASADPESFNGRCLRYLQSHGYAGELYPVNPKHRSVLDLRCYRSLDELPRSPDVALVMVPRESVLDVLQEAQAVGVPAGIVISAGFAERDARGKEMQIAIARFARTTGMLVVGPNCNGILNVHDRVMMSPTLALESFRVQPGPVGLVSQSAGLAHGAILATAQREEIGVGYVISTGNEAVLDTADFIDFLVADPRTLVIAAVIEGIKKPSRFQRALERAQEARKPLVVLKLARSGAGRRAAISHTGRLAEEDEVYDGLLEHYGAIKVNDYDELCETARLLVKTEGKRAGQARGAGLVSVSGGHLVLAADCAEEVDLAVPPLSRAAANYLRESLPASLEPRNPLDLGVLGVQDSILYVEAVRGLALEPRVGAIVAILTLERDARGVVRHLERAARELPKPLVVVWTGGSPDPGWLTEIRRSALPYFRTASDACMALRRVFASEEASARRASEDRLEPVPRVERPRALAAVHGALSEYETTGFLRALGLPTARAVLVKHENDLGPACEETGFPLAMKLQARSLVHKSDVDAVRLHVRTFTEAERTYHELLERATELGLIDLAGVLVQEMVQGVEVFVGAKNDRTFGPLVMFGIGGFYLEALRDIVLRVAPVAIEEARAMVNSIRYRALLGGYRGMAPVDCESVAELVATTSSLAVRARSWLKEMDLNPVVCSSVDGRPRIVDASMIVS